MLQPPLPVSEINRTLAALYERGDLKVLQAMHTTLHGYIVSLREQSKDAVESTDQH